MVHPLRRLLTACCLVAALCSGGVAVGAVEAGPGTKNFSAPGGVPNYFSNEAEPFLGQSAAPGPVQHSTVSGAPRVRGGSSRGRLAHRGRSYHGRSTRHVAARGVHAIHASSHASSHAYGRASARAAHSHAALRHPAAVARRRG